MNKRNHAAAPFLFSLALLCQGAHAIADQPATSSPPPKACELLQNGSLTQWGYDPSESSRVDSDASLKKGEAKAPSAVQANMCFIYKDKSQKEGATIVVVESFSPEIETAAIAKWIKETSSEGKADSGDMKIEESMVDNTPCEMGSYQIQIAGGPVIAQHYVACDQVIGKHHISINVQQPNTANGLPTMVDVKALLDQAAARLASAP